MSAFIVDKRHIDYLVHAAQQAPGKTCSGYTMTLCDHPVDTESDDVGRILWTYNVRAVEHRYFHKGDLDSGMMPGPVGLTWEDVQSYRCPIFPRQPFDPVAALKALACYEYQSCENPSWDDVQGKPIRDFCNALRDWCIAALPGYDEAKWEIAA